ncbi:hypothetical protein PVK06_003626 [Gossypium arboreum]|uniref:Uncharacterized protein n=1 Tax=Gossypium arboreum TaxID=29729 RepID=A0ABR0R705_GOSAR|nr:hypothetical protein PVK06_003626 [Gossypium arboreum]
MVDKNALWSKVILAKYGSNAKQWRFGANNLKDMSTVWREIVDNSFDARVNRWMGDKDFKWKEGFFVKAFLDREWGMLSHLLDLVGGVVLIPEVEDRILWMHDKNGSGRRRTICFLTASLLMDFGRGSLIGGTSDGKGFHERLWWFCPYKCCLSKSDSRGWCFSPHGWLKFNVNGIVFEGARGGGGVLRDEDGIVRALFSGPIDAGLREVFSWILEKTRRHWSHQVIFADLERRWSRLLRRMEMKWQIL